VLQITKGNAFLIKKDIFKNLMWYTLPDSNKQYPLTIERVRKIKSLNQQGVIPDELEHVEVVSSKPKEAEPEFVELVGQISLRTLEKADKKKRHQQQQQKGQRPQQRTQGGNQRQGGGQGQQKRQQGGNQGGQQRNQSGGNQQRNQGGQQQQRNQGGGNQQRPNNPNRSQGGQRPNNPNRNQGGQRPDNPNQGKQES
jgi:hypothetical protein